MPKPAADLGAFSVRAFADGSAHLLNARGEGCGIFVKAALAHLTAAHLTR